MEQEICVENEPIVVGSGGAVNSVNGMTGDVVLTTSDLENTSGYQTGAQVALAVSGEASARQTADANLQENINTVSQALSAEVTNRTNADGALQNSITTETTNRENADNNLQSQIDAISASSDVTDIVGTYAELQSYDKTKLSDNDIIKVLQDESRNNETTYYRYDSDTQSFTLIGEEGPYYTKSEADAAFVPQTRTVNNKALSANVTLSATDVGAVDASDVAQATGTSTTKVMSQKATTDALADKLDEADYVDFTGTDGTTAGTHGLVPAPATTDVDKFLKSDGTWDTAGSTLYSTLGQNTDGAMTQKAVTDMVYTPGHDLSTDDVRIGIGELRASVGNSSIGIGVGNGVWATNSDSLAIGSGARASGLQSSAIGGNSTASGRGSVVFYGGVATQQGEFNIGVANNSLAGYNGTVYRLLSGVYPGQNDNDAVNKKQLDDAIAGVGGPTVLTTADYNYPTSNPTQVALWLLEPGIYINGEEASIEIRPNTSRYGYLDPGSTVLVLKGREVTGGAMSYIWCGFSGGYDYGGTIYWTYSTGQVGGSVEVSNLVPADYLTSTSAALPLAANQGKVLNDKIGGDLSNLDTTDKSSLIAAINELTARVAALEGN